MSSAKEQPDSPVNDAPPSPASTAPAAADSPAIPDSQVSIIENPGFDYAEDHRVAELIEQDASPEVLAQAIQQQESPDAAVALESLPQEEAADVLEEMEMQAAADAIAEMSTPLAISVIEDLIEEDIGYAGRLLEAMAPDDATDLLQALPESDRHRLLEGMSAQRAWKLRELMHYDPQTAGGMMTTGHLAIRDHMTVEEATQLIRRSPVPEYAQHAYVLDKRGKLTGIISLRRLLISKPNDRISDLMNRSVDAIHPDLDREAVAKEFARYNYYALPVVDEEKRLLGIVTVDDVIDILRAEQTEDVQRMVGAGAHEAVYSSIGDKFKGRVPWLLVNLFTSSLAAMVVFQFSDLIGSLSILAVLMPVIANQAGNAGQQSLAVTLRGIVLDEVRPGRIKPLIRREMTVGLINGALAGVLVGAGVALFELYHRDASWQLGIVAMISMTMALTAGCLIGTSLPIMMKRWGFDPATASTIFLTMVTDTGSFFTFLGLAWLLQQWLMPVAA
jgi:magnesium transporter